MKEEINKDNRSHEELLDADIAALKALAEQEGRLESGSLLEIMQGAIEQVPAAGEEIKEKGRPFTQIDALIFLRDIYRLGAKAGRAQKGSIVDNAAAISIGDAGYVQTNLAIVQLLFPSKVSK